MKFNGAQAKIYIKYNGSIEDISHLISQGLILPDFYFKSDHDYPYSVTALCEALGFSIWVNKITDIIGFDYILEIETNMSLEESFHDLTCDISPWLAKFVSESCGVETSISI